jgi:signal transduction histidine kinase
MKLRTRLFVLSSTQLVVLGLLFAVGHIHFRQAVFPILMEHLNQKAENAVSSLASQLDVALGAGDRSLMEEAVADLVRDPDFLYVEIRDPSGTVRHHQGRRPDGAPPEGAQRTASQAADGTIRAWTQVSLEGMDLGRVSVVFDTARVESVSRWENRMALVAVVIWCAAIGYSLRLSRAFATPIRHMMEFSRKVAAGAFHEKLSCGGTGELEELEDYLNTMTRDLEAKEQERREGAARAEAMQRELRSVSRMAGMAEVATGVLHNVGNVLTSLNVSVEVVKGKLRRSKVPALSRGVEQVIGQPGGLPAFLATDKGKLFPEYLVGIATHLIAENAELLDELDSVVRNVEHIKMIVTMQQTHARAAAYREELALPDMVDDALRMGAVSFERHHIDVVKEYDDVPPLLTDKHKLLQILLNLISNARHAIKEGERDGGRLVVRLCCDEDRIIIQVEDSGVGIPPENLSRIFEHGFTTKQDGHGFGLHAAANAARELGGSLIGASPGRGQGATFTLGLPLTPPEDAESRLRPASADVLHGSALPQSRSP